MTTALDDSMAKRPKTKGNGRGQLGTAQSVVTTQPGGFMSNSSSLTSKRPPHRRALASSIVIPVGILLVPACVTDMEAEGSKVARTSQAIHNEAACAATELGYRGLVAASKSRYGNWCGPDLWGNRDEPLGDGNGVQPQLPLSCWDAACREHDYTFGRPLDGWYSCHAAGFPALPETTCTQFADDNLCDSWTSCGDLVERAVGSWSLVTGNGPPRRMCNDGSAREAQRCRYLEHALPGSKEVYTCDPCPTAPSVSFGPPPMGCAVSSLYLAGLGEDRAKSKAYHACCWFIPEASRPPTCCPPNRPDWNSDTELCEACPSDKPRWNISLYEPTCEACPQGTTWAPATQQCVALGPLAYVANFDGGSVSIVDLSLDEVVGTIGAAEGLPSHPISLSVNQDGSFVYVSHSLSSAAYSVIDTRSREVVAAFGEGSSFGVTASSQGIYAANHSFKSLDLLGSTSVLDRRILTCPRPRGGAWATAVTGTNVLVTAADGECLNILDTRTGQLRMVETPGAGTRLVASPDGTLAYIAADGPLTIVNLVAGTVSGTFAVSDTTDVALAADGALLFASVRLQDRVVAVDTTTGSVTGTIPVGRIPWGIALSQDERHLVAANRLGGSVTIIDPATFAVRATIGVGSQPSAVAIGPIPSQ